MRVSENREERAINTHSLANVKTNSGKFTKRAIALDLFAGVGGFSLGIEQAGFDVAVALEKDPIHALAHQYNFPTTQVICADLSQLSPQAIKATLPHEIDLIVGGPPCQGFSVMGKHNLNDKRNSLVFSFCDWVKVLQPRYFIMENVPGLKQRNNATLLKKLLTKFKKAGYSCLEPLQILNAADFGVPQNRRRLFILGTRKGEAPLFYPSTLSNPAPTVRDAIKDLPNLDDFPELIDSDELKLRPERLEILEASASLYVQQLRELAENEDNYSYIRDWNRLLLTGFRRTQHTLNSIERFQTTFPGEQERISRLRRLEWDGRCHTLRAGTGVERGSFTSARPLHPHYNRVISVREAARLHSFPDWFRFHTTKWHGFRQVGNSVPPLLAKALGQEVMKALQVTPMKPSETLELGNPELLKMTPTRAMREVCTFGKETSSTKL